MIEIRVAAGTGAAAAAAVEIAALLIENYIIL